ncbi:MAG: type VI secretion system accessory protein TagJ [Pseudomonadota bacterium]
MVTLDRHDPLATLTALKGEVREQPDNTKLRVFFFQLLCVVGDWPGAARQLEILADLDASTLAMVAMYRPALANEPARADIFAGQREPHIMGKPPTWLADLIRANGLLNEQQPEAAAQARARAFEQAPTSSGTIDGQPFAWIADGDTRLGPLCEAIIGETYYWIPFDHIHEINIEKPTDLRDMVWLPARFVWHNQGEAFGLIPTRYPGLQQSDDPVYLMASQTRWDEHEHDHITGTGQRVWITEQESYSLLDIRHIQFAEKPDADDMSDDAGDEKHEAIIASSASSPASDG